MYLFLRGEKMKLSRYKLSLEIARSCLSIEQLSQMAGISRVTLQRLKNSRQEARPQTIGKLAKALDIKVEDLLD